MPPDSKPCPGLRYKHDKPVDIQWLSQTIQVIDVCSDGVTHKKATFRSGKAS